MYGPHGDKLDLDKVTSLIHSTHGNLSEVARIMGVNRSTIYEWIKREPSIAEAVDEARERAIDIAEASLTKQIAEGNTAATIFMLKTRGKSRGYVERQEITGANGGPIETRGVDVKGLSDDELEQLHRLARKATHTCDDSEG